MMCSSFVRSLAAMAAAAAICATAFPDLGQNADWSAKNERGEGEGTSAEGGSEGEEEAEHRYFRVVAAVLAESSAREGGREEAGRSVGGSTSGKAEEDPGNGGGDHEASRSKPQTLCEIAPSETFPDGVHGDGRGGERTDRPDIWKESGCHRCLRRQPPKFFGGILINF